MISTKQTILHDPSSGQHGNCLSAVLASLLHLPIETVPVFSDPDHWVKDLNVWLRPHGLAYLSFPDPTFNLTLSNFGIKGLMHEIGGMSTRWKDVGHSCVAEDGQVVFDPHPSNDGLNAGIESSGILVALEPWKWARIFEIDELRSQLELARMKSYLVSISEIAVERDALQAKFDNEMRRYGELFAKYHEVCVDSAKFTKIKGEAKVLRDLLCETTDVIDTLIDDDDDSEGTGLLAALKARCISAIAGVSA